jgi:hypothetical protein
LETCQEFVLALVLSEDLLWPEHVLYFACYFWSKCQACQQLENTLEEMKMSRVLLDSSCSTVDVVPKGPSTDEMQANIKVRRAAIRTYMQPFLPHIRLLAIAGSKLEVILTKYSCFTQMEKSNLYSCFLGNNKFAYLPDEFCKVKEARRASNALQSIYIFGYVETEIGNLSSCEISYECQCPLFGDILTDLDSTKCFLQLKVKVPTQIKPPDVESESYEESFTVLLANPKGKRHKAGPLTQSAKYNSHVLVDIYPPFDFHAGNNGLCVVVLCHKSGLYPTFKPTIAINTCPKKSRKEWLSVDFNEPYPPI